MLLYAFIDVPILNLDFPLLLSIGGLLCALANTRLQV